VKRIASICLLTLFAGQFGDRLQQYHAIETYEIRPGIIATPVYTAGHDLCEISIERRHHSDNSVDVDAAMSKELIMSLFDELVPKYERGGTSGRLPADTEITETDLGMLSTRIPYENVTLWMYGKKDKLDNQKYIAAIIIWDKTPCNAK